MALLSNLAEKLVKMMIVPDDQFLLRKEDFLNSLNDPLVKNIEWTPLVSWWTNFKTVNVVEDNFWRLIIKSSFQSYFFASIFLVVWSLITMQFLVWVDFSKFKTDIKLFAESLSLVIFPSIFIFVWLFLLIRANRKKIFDKSMWYLHDWKKQKDNYGIFKPGSNDIALSSIHALQIIKEYVQSSKSSYTSYELNLVLKDTKRINLMDYWWLEDIRKQAETIWRYLWAPVWDTTSNNF